MHSPALATDPTIVSARTRAMILETLDSVVESTFFRKSRRYPALLRYSVLHTLDGDFFRLKERMIGVEVFGRPADYDTNEDPVVRIAAGEVRKRLVQYFVEHPEGSVRIDLPAGSYVAEFHIAADEPHTEETSQPSKEAFHEDDALVPLAGSLPGEAPGLDVSAHDRLPVRFAIRFAVLGIALCVMVCAALWGWHQRTERQRNFWRPVLQAGQPLILVGLRPSLPGPDEAAGERAPTGSAAPKYRVVMSNTIAAADICSVLGQMGKLCNLSEAPTASFTDIRNHSLILVGAYDNPWTDRLLAPLRFHFYRAPVTEESERRFRYIVDQKVSPNHSPWVVDSELPSPQRTRDYFLIARFHSDVTDNSVVVAAGIGTYGTRSAAEYVISQEKMAALLALAPKGWAGFNFEAVLQTDVVQGHTGHTHVAATNFW